MAAMAVELNAYRKRSIAKTEKKPPRRLEFFIFN
jgi:hypothetical protein